MLVTTPFCDHHVLVNECELCTLRIRNAWLEDQLRKVETLGDKRLGKAHQLHRQLGETIDLLGMELSAYHPVVIQGPSVHCRACNMPIEADLYHRIAGVVNYF